MQRWTKDAVLRASEDWQWVPPGAQKTEIAGAVVIDYPDWAGMGFHVCGIDTDRSPITLIDAVTEEARVRGRRTVNWFVSPSTRPREVESELLNRGAEIEVELGIFGCDLSHGVPDMGPLPGLSGKIVDDAASLTDVEIVSAAVWGGEPSSGERRQQQLRELETPLEERSSFRVACYDAAGAAIATGGCEMVDGVARLWGACTLPEARGVGAYRMVLKTRLDTAAERGASLALVHARVDTSGPIVERLGFTSYGSARAYALALE